MVLMSGCSLLKERLKTYPEFDIFFPGEGVLPGSGKLVKSLFKDVPVCLLVPHLSTCRVAWEVPGSDPSPYPIGPRAATQFE